MSQVRLHSWPMPLNNPPMKRPVFQTSCEGWVSLFPVSVCARSEPIPVWPTTCNDRMHLDKIHCCRTPVETLVDGKQIRLTRKQAARDLKTTAPREVVAKSNRNICTSRQIKHLVRLPWNFHRTASEKIWVGEFRQPGPVEDKQPAVLHVHDVSLLPFTQTPVHVFTCVSDHACQF